MSVSTASTVFFGVSGLINFFPVLGVISAERLGKAYGLPLRSADDNLVILLRHRACLFGIVGGLMLHAAYEPEGRQIATVAGFSSMVSFMALAVFSKTLNKKLLRILYADIIGCICLGLAQVI